MNDLNGSATFPLSFAQQRWWNLVELAPHSALPNEPQTVRIQGPLNVQALHQALDAIVTRHKTLCTTFGIGDGNPVQVVAARCSVALPVIDLRDWSHTTRAAEVQRRLREEIQRPFDLTCDLLLRALLLWIGAAEYILLLVTHRIAFDEWSTGILFQEITTCYEAFATNRTARFPVLPLQYTDYTHWQQQWLQGARLATHLAYWQHQLKGAPAVLDLPTGRPRPAVQSYRGARHTWVCPPSLSSALRILSQQEGVTLFMMLLAAFQTLLHRYTGQEDIVVGAPVSGRSQRETEGMIGCFENMLVLRLTLPGTLRFREVLRRVRAMTIEDSTHQEVPFQQLVDALQPERSLSHTPLVQVTFTLQHAPMPALQLLDLALTHVNVDHSMTMYDLTLSVREQKGELQGIWVYNSDLFDTTTIARMAGHWQTLLEGIVTDPGQTIALLPLLTEGERHQLVIEWNTTRAPYPREACLHEVFEAQVERTPDAIAVEGEDKQLTYRELNRRANQLAHYLRTLSVGPEVLVGLYVERSIEMLIGLLGILKAGGAYVPLDVVYPPERLAYMLSDAQVSVLVTLQRAHKELPTYGGRLLCLDTEWDTITRECDKNPVSGVKPTHLAAVLYTSGSTGTPKGVMIEHQSLVYYTETASELFALQAGDRMLQFASISFDTAAEEIFPSLRCGATLVLRTDAMLDVDLFLQKCHEWALTVLDLPTAYWHALTTQLSTEAARLLSTVRLVIIGGERALWESLVTWRRHVDPRIRLVNSYGPTEGTVVATTADLSTAVDVEKLWQAVPIGCPIRNVQTYVLDPHLQPVAIGIPGELYIGGAGVTRGYLNQPELTVERFLPNPFHAEPGARLYKTGDLVRYLPDGTLAFLGRIDHQVKIRGFRIELGEIEAVLRQHPAVHEAVVVVQEDVAGEPRLVAYIVSAPQATPSLSELWRFLQPQLPVYMLPAACVPLTVLPLTPNGKVDRQRLPAPTWERPAADRRIVPPRHRLESQLAQVWEQVLGIQPISVEDDFFALGGDSLLAVRLLAHMKHVCGQELPLAALFHAPTVAQLADVLRQGGWSQPWKSLIPVHPEGTKPPFFWLGIKDKHALLRYLGPEQPVYGFMHHGADGTRARYRHVEDFAAHYLVELRTVQSTGPYYLGGYSFGGLVAFEMAQQLHRQGQDVAFLALLDPTRSRSALSSPPPTRGFRKDLGRHLHSLISLAPQERRTYLLDRVRGRLQASATMIREMCTRMICEALLRMRYPLPLSLRVFYTLDLYERAIHTYDPHSYPGRMVLFLAATTAPKMQAAWEPLGIGGVEVHVVPGDHKTILGEPHCAVWVTLLRDHLRKSQAAAAGIELERG